jgi:hypothetical protein
MTAARGPNAKRYDWTVTAVVTGAILGSYALAAWGGFACGYNAGAAMPRASVAELRGKNEAMADELTRQNALIEDAQLLNSMDMTPTETTGALLP